MERVHKEHCRRIQKKYSRQLRKNIGENTAQNSEKYSPKKWFPETESLFPTMCVIHGTMSLRVPQENYFWQIYVLFDIKFSGFQMCKHTKNDKYVVYEHYVIVRHLNLSPLPITVRLHDLGKINPPCVDLALFTCGNIEIDEMQMTKTESSNSPIFPLTYL